MVYLFENRAGIAHYTVQGSNPNRAKILFSTGSEVDPAFYSLVIVIFFSGLRRPGRDIDYSPPSSAEVKSSWSYTSTSPVYFHGVDRQTIPFF